MTIRTFVRVELEEPDTELYPPFWEAMQALGFKRTIIGKKTRKTFRLPKGLYLIEKASAEEALAMTKQAVTNAKVEARMFCVPAGPGVRFANLQEDDEAAEDEMFDGTEDPPPAT
jgi:hypothetical protein